VRLTTAALLCLAVTLPTAAAASRSSTALATNDCVITAHGATANDDRLDTVAIQAAIEACAARGGGRVLVPAGRFVTGTIELRSGIEFHLGAGALLVGSPNIADYPELAESRGDDHAPPPGTVQPRTGEQSGGIRALLVARGKRHVAITGTGTLDGNGTAFWGEGFIDSGRSRPDLPRPRPWIWFKDSTHVTVRDVFLTHTPSYFLTFQQCDDVFIEGVRMSAHPRSPNSDGIQIEGSRNIRIVGVDIRTGDDAIVLKSSAGPIENVLVTGSYLESDDSAFKFGTGTEHNITRVRFSDSIIAKSRIGIAIFMKDGGELRDFTASGIDISTSSRHSTDYAVYFDVDRRHAASKLGTVRDITLRDLRVRTRGNLLLAGHPAAPIRNLTVDGLDIEIASPVDVSALKNKPRGNALLAPLPDSVDYAKVNSHVTLAHIDGARVRNVRLSGAPADLGMRHGLHLTATRATRIEGFERTSVVGVLAAVVMREPDDLALVESRIADGPVFVSIEGKPRGAIVLRNTAGGERSVDIAPAYRSLVRMEATRQ
jgi:hypothetical protein